MLHNWNTIEKSRNGSIINSDWREERGCTPWIWKLVRARRPSQLNLDENVRLRLIDSMVSFAIDRVTRCSSCFVGFFSARSSSIEEVEQREIFNLIKFQSRRYYYRSHSHSIRERESLNLIVKFLLHAIISELRPETIYNVSILRSQWFDTFFLSSLRILIYRIELINFQLKNKNLYKYINRPSF